MKNFKKFLLIIFCNVLLITNNSIMYGIGYKFFTISSNSVNIFFYDPNRINESLLSTERLEKNNSYADLLDEFKQRMSEHEYWKDYKYENVLIAYAELNTRNYKFFNVAQIKKLNDFSLKFNQPDIDSFLNQMNNYYFI